MKKILLVASILLSCSLNLNSQTNKGNFMLGGALSGSITSEEHFSPSSSVSLSANLSPRVGYFIRRNFAIGLELPLNVSNSETYKSSDYGVGPFLRGYLGKNKMKFFMQSQFDFSKGHEEYQYYDYSYYYNGTPQQYTVKSESLIRSFTAGIGAAYFLNEHIGLEGALNYQMRRYTTDIYINQFSNVPHSGAGNFASTEDKIYLSVGLQIYLSRKKKEEKN